MAYAVSTGSIFAADIQLADPVSVLFRGRACGAISVRNIEKGPEFPGPSQGWGYVVPLFIVALILVEPVLGAGQALRPVSQVEISSPRIVVSLFPFRIGHVPGQISLPLPGTPIV